MKSSKSPVAKILHGNRLHGVTVGRILILKSDGTQCDKPEAYATIKVCVTADYKSNSLIFHVTLFSASACSQFS